MGFFSSVKNLFKNAKSESAAARTTAAEGVLAAPRPSAFPAPASSAPWRDSLLLALRGAEPKLSIWLDLLLNGVDKADAGFDERLLFFFSALEAPAGEAQSFLKKFHVWLDSMGYEAVADFRSELQYRLALALELEDEEDEKSRLLIKLSDGLAKTRAQLSTGLNALLNSQRDLDDAFWEELEEILLTADVGYETAMELSARLKRRAAKSGARQASALRELMRAELAEIFASGKRISAVNPPEVVLMVGVNGVGKTTTIAKLASRAASQGKKVLIAAGDTFRAAAIEQLEIWAKRSGALFYAKAPGSDPAAVAFEALDKALAEGCDLVFIDTAGRLQTKTNLMEELGKIRRVLAKRHPGAPHRSVLVIDATTGQNALSQTKLFNEACGLDEIILTKLDGTAKGGVAVALALQFGIPITFVGLGEKMEDLRPFDGKAFAVALLEEGKE